MELMETQALIFCADAKNTASFMERNVKFQKVTTMFKNIVNGFMKVMNSVKAAFEESYNGNYAGWNEGEELLMLNNIRAGVQ